MKPQPSPADTLRRVIKIARVNGMVVVFPVSFLCALIAIAMGDLVSAGTGLLVAAAGWSEWHGAKLLQRGRARGINWLVRSQLYLLGIIEIYAVTRMGSYDPEYVRSLVTPDMKQMFDSAGLNLDQVMPMVRTAFYALYGSLIVLTLFYQGGLALYYWRRTETVQAALDKTGLPS
jgi:hypothetical protein